MNPPPSQADPAMARLIQEVVAQQLSYVGQNVRLAGGMEPMTTVIRVQSRQLKTACQATNDAVALDDRDGGTFRPRELIGGSQTHGPCSQNHHLTTPRQVMYLS